MEYVFHYSGFSIPRTADSQLAQGVAIDKRDLLPGDLVFFNNPEESPEFITHVGLYIGGGRFLHASVANGVCIRSLETGYYAEHFVCARRLLNASASAIPSYDYFTLN
jgi:cell wall-associated NlpC family hydrolase